MTTQNEDSHIQEQLRDGVYQLCPACTMIIFKDGGCNFVQCFCTQAFCWNCRKIKGDQGCAYGNTECNSH